MERRRFLTISPGGLPTLAPAFLPDEPHEPPPDYTLLRVSRRAMATRFEIAIPYGTPHALAAATAALDLIDDLEEQLTVYSDDSEVSRLNQTAASNSVRIEKRLLELLQFAASITNDTAGAFDIAMGSLIKTWGFYKREGRIPTPIERAAAMRCSGMKHVILDSDQQTVKFRAPGVELNLGGIGKGYALDRAAAVLHEYGIASALLHGGGSSVYALGCPPGDFRGWPIRILHPANDGRALGTVRLADCGFGTSAATFQFFEYNGKKYGHLLDPRVGAPASGTASVSVSAPTASEADAMSTAFFVMGEATTREFCRSRPHLAVVLLPDNTDNLTRIGDWDYSPPELISLITNTNY